VVGPAGPCGCGCALTPETTYGFAVDVFARQVLHAPLDPWERWVAIHAGEMILDSNGVWRPRFRRLVLLVARQNGKTHLLVVLALFWLFVQGIPLILGTSNKLEYAKESLDKAFDYIESTPELAEDMPRQSGYKIGNNDVRIRTRTGCRYKVAAAGKNAGRSLTVHRWICDETLTLYDWECYKSAYNAMQAVDDAQAWFIGSQGDDRSVVLDALHKAALAFIEGGETDEDGEAVGLFEYSAPDGAETDDVEALAAANPNMNRRGLSNLVADAKAAKLAGGTAEAGFRTEAMCIRVKNLDAAVDPKAWESAAGQFEMAKDRRAMVVDISGDMRRATLAVARVTPGDKVQLALVASWDGADAIKRMRAELPGLVKAGRARKLGYLPIGPGAAIMPAMQSKGRSPFPPGCEVEPITGEVAALCMGFAEQVQAGEIVHLDEPLLNVQVVGAAKKWSNGRWVFDYSGERYAETAYAAAGAVHLARMMPAPVGAIRLIGPDDDE